MRTTYDKAPGCTLPASVFSSRQPSVLHEVLRILVVPPFPHFPFFLFCDIIWIKWCGTSFPSLFFFFWCVCVWFVLFFLFYSQKDVIISALLTSVTEYNGLPLGSPAMFAMSYLGRSYLRHCVLYGKKACSLPRLILIHFSAAVVLLE